MRRVVVLTSVVAAAALALAAPGAAAQPAQGPRDAVAPAVLAVQDPPPWVSGDTGDHAALPEAPDAVTAPGATPTQVLVRFADRVGAQQQQSALGALAGGADRVRGTHYVAVPTDGEDPAAVVARLKQDPRVADVEVDNVRSATAWTDDPLLYYAWPYIDLMRLPRAWDLGQGAGTVIAVVDTGVSATHPELAGSVLQGWDFVDGDADASDGQWHGTAVAATAIGRGDNGVGSVGAAWQAKVLPVRVLDSTGNGTDSDVAAGITYAADRGADVINLSLGGPAPSLALREALDYAVAHGSVVVVASGNGGTQLPEYPAAYAADVPGVLSVGATDHYGALADFSSWGDSVSLAAPGDAIAVPYGSGYVAASGTSFAAPFVSGVAALLVAHGLSPVQVADALTSTARDAGPRGIDPYYGHGVLDAAAALGLGASVPLDRPAGDGGVDDTTAHAQPLALAATATGSVSPQGDQDWYSVALPARGWYTATVTPEPGTSGLPATRASLVALDASGGVLASSGPTGTADGTLLIPVPASGTVRIGVGDVSGSDVGDTRYRLHVALVESGVKLRTWGTSTPNNSGTASTAIGDLTGDGVPDVLVDQGATAPLVLAGAGDGTLTDPLALPVPPGSSFGWNPSVAILDVDRDGDLDAAVVSAAGLLVTLQGPGGLVPGPTTALPAGTNGLLVQDMSGDGPSELVVWNGGSLLVYRTGVGGLVLERTVPVDPSATGSYRPALADLNGDGRADVVTAGGSIRLQAGDGSFGAGESFGSSGLSAPGVAVGDVTGDGLPDVVRTSSTNSGHVYVNPGTGAGHVGAAVAYPAYEIPEPITLADVDGDARLDVVVANAGWNRLSVLRQLPDGTLAAPQLWTLTNGVSWFGLGALTAGDLTGDGATDLVLGSSAGVMTFTQLALDAVGPRAWVQDLSPAPHSAGQPVRPTVRITLGRDLAAGAVTATTVRLRDGATGDDVAATRSVDAATHVLSVTPTADLPPGHHYEVLVSGLTDADGAPQDLPIRTWLTVGAGGDRFTPIEPWRVLDTRDPSDPAYGRVWPGSPAHLALGGVYVPADATAVVLNVTAAQPSGVGNIRVYPTPAGADVPPNVSNLNVVPGVAQPNLVTVRLGAGGYVSLAADGMTTDLVADLAGYYSPGGATGFVPLTPVRAMDTRFGTGGVPAQKVPVNGWVDLQVAGHLGVPADASAVVLNVTAASVAGTTNVRVYPTPAASEPQDPPLVSSLNLRAGRDQANLVTVTLGDAGKVRFYTQSASLDLIADVAGYYSPTGDQGFVPLTPVRIADTRTGLGLPGGLLRAGVARTLGVAGVAGVPASATAAVLNVTAVQPRAFSNVRVFPASASGEIPLVSNLNVVMGRDEPNLALVRLGTGGAVSVYSQTADLGLVVDVSGYFRP